MKATKTKALLNKWYGEYPTACKKLVDSISIIDDLLGSEQIPPNLLAEYHTAIGHDIIEYAQGDVGNGELEQIRFENLNKLMVFRWCGKLFLKYNNDFAGKKPNCKCIDTKEERKFKPDDTCLIPKKFVKHQIAFAC